ncbi:hypothetical protein JCM1840_007429 [Sporobolomyces johnsonii]
MTPSPAQLTTAKAQLEQLGFKDPTKAQIEGLAATNARTENELAEAKLAMEAAQAGQGGDSAMTKVLECLTVVHEKQAEAQESKERNEGKRQGPKWSNLATEEETEAVHGLGKSKIPFFLYERVLKHQPLPLDLLRLEHLKKTYTDTDDTFTPLNLWSDLSFAHDWRDYLPSLRRFTLLVRDLNKSCPNDFPDVAVDMVTKHEVTVQELFVEADSDADKMDVLVYDIMRRENLSKTTAAGKVINIGPLAPKVLEEARRKRAEMRDTVNSDDPFNIYKFLPRSSDSHPLKHITLPPSTPKNDGGRIQPRASSSGGRGGRGRGASYSGEGESYGGGRGGYGNGGNRYQPSMALPTVSTTPMGRATTKEGTATAWWGHR